MCLDGLMVAVESEDLGAPGRRLDQPEQEAKGRRLAGTVRAEVAHYLAFANLKIEVREA